MVKATQSVTCGNCSQLFPPIKIMSSKKKKRSYLHLRDDKRSNMLLNQTLRLFYSNYYFSSDKCTHLLLPISLLLADN